MVPAGKSSDSSRRFRTELQDLCMMLALLQLPQCIPFLQPIGRVKRIPCRCIRRTYRRWGPHPGELRGVNLDVSVRRTSSCCCMRRASCASCAFRAAAASFSLASVSSSDMKISDPSCNGVCSPH